MSEIIITFSALFFSAFDINIFDSAPPPEKRCPWFGHSLPDQYFGGVPEIIYVHPNAHSHALQAVILLENRIFEEFGESLVESPDFPNFLTLPESHAGGFGEDNGRSEIYFGPPNKTELKKKNAVTMVDLATGETDIWMNEKFLVLEAHWRDKYFADAEAAFERGEHFNGPEGEFSGDKWLSYDSLLVRVMAHEILHVVGISSRRLEDCHIPGNSRWIMGERTSAGSFGNTPNRIRFHQQTLDFLKCKYL